MKNHKSRSVWFFALMMILIVTHAHAITTFTVNGQTEIELKFADLYKDDGGTPLRFEADTSRPGGTLTFELYIDTGGDGRIQPELDVNLFKYVEQPMITDGGSRGVADADGIANGRISFKIERGELFPGFSTTGFILRAVDADGSSAAIILHTVLPELKGSSRGRLLPRAAV
ncbi:hypothetical protein HYR99_02270 [Candidatus Poribacteria bacterium]|nr:hypothetical protein [Candidatus Poribacteria bacterium]